MAHVANLARLASIIEASLASNYAGHALQAQEQAARLAQKPTIHPRYGTYAEQICKSDSAPLGRSA